MELSVEILDKEFLQSNYRSFGKILINFFQNCKLISEISIKDGYETFNFLGKLIQKKFNFDQITNPSDKESRAILSLYLVWLGIFKYGEESNKELWIQLDKSLNISTDGNHRANIGKSFIKCLKENKLEYFKDLKGHVYISQILLHGLLPIKSTDYFINEFVFQNSHNFIYKTSNDLLREWKEYSSKKNPPVPTPIKNFLDYGYPVNYQIIDQFKNLRYQWNKNVTEKDIKSTLPEYMIKSFFKCVKDKNIKKEVYDLNIFSKKRLYIKLSYNGLVLVIPQQYFKNNIDSINILIECNNNKIINKKLDLVKLKNNTYVFEYNEITLPPSQYYSIDFNKEKYYFTSSYIEGNNNEKISFWFIEDNSQKVIYLNNQSYIPKNINILLKENITLKKEKNIKQLNEYDLFLDWSGYKVISLLLLDNASFCLLENKTFTQVESKELNLLTQKEIDLTIEDNKNISHFIISTSKIPIFTNQKEIYIKTNQNLINKYTLQLLNYNEPSSTLNLYFQNDNNFISLSEIENLKSGIYSLKFTYGFNETIEKDFILLNDIEIFYESEKNSIKVKYPIDINVNNNSKELIYYFDNNKAFEEIVLGDLYEYPIKLLITNSRYRWSKHSQNILVEWKNWISKSEELYIPDIDSMEDRRVLIDIDDKIINLDITLISNNETLKTIHPEKYSRNMNLFFFNLKDLSEHLKNLKVLNAEIYLTVNYKNKIKLYDIYLEPKINNLHIRTLSLSKEFEKIEINWDFDDTKNYDLEFFYEYEKELQNIKPLNIGLLKPPIVEKIPRAIHNGIWECYLSIKRKGLFKKSKFNKELVKEYWKRYSKLIIEVFINSLCIEDEYEIINIKYKKPDFKIEEELYFIYFSEKNITDIYYIAINKNFEEQEIKIPIANISGNWFSYISDDITNFNEENRNLLTIWSRSSNNPIIKNIRSIEMNHSIEKIEILWDGKLDINKHFFFYTSNISNNYKRANVVITIESENKGLVDIDAFDLDKEEVFYGYISSENNNIENRNDISISWKRNPQKKWMNLTCLGNESARVLNKDQIFEEVEVTWKNETNKKILFIYFPFEQPDKKGFILLENNISPQIIKIPTSNIDGYIKIFLDEYNDNFNLNGLEKNSLPNKSSFLDRKIPIKKDDSNKSKLEIKLNNLSIDDKIKIALSDLIYVYNELKTPELNYNSFPKIIDIELVDKHKIKIKLSRLCLENIFLHLYSRDKKFESLTLSIKNLKEIELDIKDFESENYLYFYICTRVFKFADREIEKNKLKAYIYKNTNFKEDFIDVDLLKNCSLNFSETSIKNLDIVVNKLKAFSQKDLEFNLPLISFLKDFISDKNNLNFIKCIGIDNIYKLLPYSSNKNLNIAEFPNIDFSVINNISLIDKKNSPKNWFRIENRETLKIKGFSSLVLLNETNNFVLKDIKNNKIYNISSIISKIPLDVWIIELHIPLVENSNIKNINFKEKYQENEKNIDQIIKEWEIFSIESNQNIFNNTILNQWFWYRFNFGDKYRFLTGALALISRLRGNDYYHKSLINKNNTVDSLNKLIKETNKIVLSNFPKKYLTDLIVSEILLSWYYFKSLVSVN